MKLLTPKEAALQAKVSRSLVYAWCEERRLPHMRAGAAGKRGRILIREDDLFALLEQCRVERNPSLAVQFGPGPGQHLRA